MINKHKAKEFLNKFNIKKKYTKLSNQFKLGKKIANDPFFILTKEKSELEKRKLPVRTAIINFFVTYAKANYYLEIGVRDPNANFVKINCQNKFSVDPGVEFKSNPVDFKLTSDEFFKQKNENQFSNLKKDLKFDVIFIDGLHTADQVEKDILNSLEHLSDSGFIILHDCNPPTEYHQREDYYFRNSPAGGLWNGTTWKAFYKFRHNQDLFSICFDTDWGVAVLSKLKLPLFNNLNPKIENHFYEYEKLDKNRTTDLNLQDFLKWKNLLEK